MSENLKFTDIDPEDLDCLMTWEEFLESVEDGCLIDYDGFGRLATQDKTTTKMMESNIEIYPSEAGFPSRPHPKWATHVMWFNK
jgi:hypothetical protein